MLMILVNGVSPLFAQSGQHTQSLFIRRQIVCSMCPSITIQLTRTKSNSHFHTWYPIIRQICACSVGLHDAAVVRFGQEPLAKLVLDGKSHGLFGADLDGRL
jgi:hypothetical protein